MPEPVLVSIAAALAAKSVTSLYDLVKRKFAGRKDAEGALTAASGAAPESTEVATLAAHLAAAEKEDPTFRAELRNIWQQVSVGNGSVVNQVTGNVSGKVLQARDIQGGVSF
ncbi:hypothetical protein ACFQ1S_03065 [Kibdelosporangium lantanae]|uniref:Uncharacterized protein n=1 Tax=Kibdelosporangium lantanae TaxID=1497396 RepID=A0ABW3M428_9PSEU